jgi:hypothetical protein
MVHAEYGQMYSDLIRQLYTTEKHTVIGKNVLI